MLDGLHEEIVSAKKAVEEGSEEKGGEERGGGHTVGRGGGVDQRGTSAWSSLRYSDL